MMSCFIKPPSKPSAEKPRMMKTKDDNKKIFSATKVIRMMKKVLFPSKSSTGAAKDLPTLKQLLNSERNRLQRTSTEEKLRSVEQSSLRKEIQARKLQAHTLRRETNNRLQGSSGVGMFPTFKPDQEVCSRDRVHCLQNKGIRLINDSIQLCIDLTEKIKERELKSESDMKVQGFKREFESLTKSLEYVSYGLREKTTPDKKRSKLEVMIPDLKAGEVKQLVAELLRGNNAKDTIPCNTHKMKQPELEMVKKDEHGRGKREKFPAAALLSPYVSREVCLVERLTREEMKVFQYIMAPTTELFQHVYHSASLDVPKVVMESLFDGTWLHQGVVDTWAYLLNFEELNNKSNGSVYRLFCSTQTLPEAYYFREKSMEETVNIFSSNVRNIMERLDVKRADEFDIIICPLLINRHFYMVCFNLKDLTIELIDNSTIGGKDIEKYTGVPLKLQKVLCTFLTNTCPENKELRKLKKSKIERREMEWRTTNNFVDCGVFVMRHMETYKGEKDWSCGFKDEGAEQDRQIKGLRRKYCAKLILNEYNEEREHILHLAEKFDKFSQKKKKKVLANIKEKMKQRQDELINGATQGVTVMKKLLCPTPSSTGAYEPPTALQEKQEFENKNSSRNRLQRTSTSVSKQAAHVQNQHSKSRTEKLRPSAVEQSLRKEIEASKLEVDTLRRKNNNLLHRLEGSSGDGLFPTFKPDQEVCIRLRVHCLQNKGIPLINDSIQLCMKLTENIKERELKSGLDSEIIMGLDTKVQGFKREFESLTRSLEYVSKRLREKTTPDNKCSEHEVMIPDLKAGEVERLKAELATTVRGNNVLSCEVQNAKDTISCSTHKMKELELEMIKKNENTYRLQTDLQNCKKELARVNGILAKVCEERDRLRENVKLCGGQITSMQESLKKLATTQLNIFS